VRQPERLWELRSPQIVRPVTESNRPVALAGDAMPFLWPVPTSRLTYRTVFDLDVRPGETLIDAWTRGAPADAIVIINPAELRRLRQTYRNLGEDPAAIEGRVEPFILER
jgi:hypothetical protein